MKDGVIGNIAACTYIPTDLQCKDADSDACLTAGQIETIRMVYSDQHVPVTLADGTSGYARFGRGGAATIDWHVSIYQTARYVDRVKARMGEQKVASFARFLVTPHVGHEMDGPGPAEIDVVGAMDAWVERGVAPDHLVVAKRDAASAVTFERPACPFPQFARYNGGGDPTKAASFHRSDR